MDKMRVKSILSAVFKIFHRSTDFLPRFLDIVNLCSKILQRILKCSFLYFVLLSHDSSQASQADTDPSIELMKWNVPGC